MSTGRYLGETRLRERGGGVKAVAAEAGYPDPFTFSRAFRSVLGVPPSAVRPRDTAVSDRARRLVQAGPR